jgi:GH15 family glucan-1,4-alpha-glucosidase
MAKSIILANGTIQVGINTHGYVTDFFFPFVGVENHVRGESHRIGIWFQNKLSWLDDGSWDIAIDLQEDSFIGTMRCVHKHTGLILHSINAVYNEKNIFLREIEIINPYEHKEEVKIYFHQVFSINETTQGDTNYYDPIKNAIIHYKGRRMFKRK